MVKAIFSKSALVSVLISLSWVCAPARSSPVSVGGTSLEIPPPPGCAPVTPQMTALFLHQQRFAPPDQERLGSYIPAADVLPALKDEARGSIRECVLETSKALVDKSVSKSDFSAFKRAGKAQMDDLMKEAERKLPGLLKKVNEDLARNSGVDYALSVSPTLNLPPHEDTDRTWAYFMLARVEARDAAGQPASVVVAITTTWIHVRAKLLCLYVYGEESGLEWTRTISKQWAAAILAANPSGLRSSAQESLPPAGRDLGWMKLAGEVVVAVIIAAIITLIRRARQRGNARTPQGVVYAQNSPEAVAQEDLAPPCPIRNRNR